MDNIFCLLLHLWSHGYLQYRLQYKQGFPLIQILDWYFHIIFNFSTSSLILGIILNSFCSILSFNSFDFNKMLGGRAWEDKKKHHEPTLSKQILYHVIFFLLNTGYLSISLDYFFNFQLFL